MKQWVWDARKGAALTRCGQRGAVGCHYPSCSCCPDGTRLPPLSHAVHASQMRLPSLIPRLCMCCSFCREPVSPILSLGTPPVYTLKPVTSCFWHIS